MSIKFKEVTGVTRKAEVVRVFHGEWENGLPIPTELTGKSADTFLTLYRGYLSKNDDPADRIIPGIDDQKDGHYSMEAEEAATREVLSLTEKKNYRQPSPDMVQFLYDVSEYEEDAAKMLKKHLKMKEQFKKISDEYQSDERVTQDECEYITSLIKTGGRLATDAAEMQHAATKLLEIWL